MLDKDDFIGQQIGNNQIISVLGSGSFGTVFLARNLHVAAHMVAIKFMNVAHVNSRQERENFIHEASILVKLKHPFILPILDFGILDVNGSESLPYMITEYAAHASLRQRLPSHSPQLVPLSEVLTILTQVGQALHFAHQQQIVHRDLKPENILFNAQGAALLADFGIATEMPTSTIRHGTPIIGTPIYMAPEQFEGTVSKLSDQYSLGCIAYELVTGRKPFQAVDFISMGMKHAKEPPIPPRQFNPSLPAHIEQAILKAMAKDRTRRHVDIATFIAALNTPASSFSASTGALITPAGPVELGSLPLTIGRARNNRYVVDDSQVSSHHAVIHPADQGHTITDVGSTNGTFVNGQRLAANNLRLLKSGDSIRMGNTVCTYQISTPAQVEKNTYASPAKDNPPLLPPVGLPPPPPPRPRPLTPLPQPAVGAVSPEKPALYHTPWIVALISVLLLLTLAVGFLVVPPILSNKGATAATPASNSTAVAAAHARSMTATATTMSAQATASVVHVTATAQALLTATITTAHDLLTSATSGTPALDDPLNDNSGNHGWSENSNCAFTAGAYHATILQKEYFTYCPASSTSFTNFAYQVQMSIAQGDEGCLLLRYSATGTSHSYDAFCISSDGSYHFITKPVNDPSNSALKDGTSTAITTGRNQSNSVTVIAQGPKYTLYINGQYVSTVTDSTTSQGSIGVGARDIGNATDVACSNAKVWEIKA